MPGGGGPSSKLICGKVRLVPGANAPCWPAAATEVSVMKLRSSRLIVAGIFLFPSEIGAQQNLATADAARANAIPFQLEGGFLIQVEGGIGQLEGLRFILDTGATHSVIDRRIANRFPLVLHPKRVFNFDRFVSVDWAEFPEVHLGPITMRNVSMIVTQLVK